MLLPRRNLLIGAAALPFAGLAVGALPRPVWSQEAAKVVHGLAMHGEPKYGPDFAHLDYADPTAPKGGEIRLAAIGDAFDTLNPFTLRGTAAAGASTPFETLATSTSDEAFSEYGLLAESIEVPDDRSWVAFTLRPQAVWHDGKPITVDDVIFSFEILKTKGHPFYRAYYASVEKAEKIGERKIKFSFAGGVNRELPLIMGQLPVLPKHYWEGKNFEATTLEIPLGSGPYKIASFEPGRSVVLQRVKDYWGKDLPINIGQDNWDIIRYDYYRDTTVALEAFKAGNYDYRNENSAKQWATAYDIPQVNDGRIKKELIPDERTQGMQGFVFNIRRDIFKERAVRQALAYAFDFEWTNKTLFYGQYTRTKSYFAGGELASTGVPAGAELEILEKYRGQVPEEVFTTAYEPPSTDGSGNNRANLRKGLEILKGAGWAVQGGTLTNTASGAAMEFEILLNDPVFERICQPFVQNLERMGVRSRIRIVDTAQYQNRIDEFDFDVIVATFGQSESPGNEQRDFWSSAAAVTPGSRNLAGIKDPVVDKLIDLVITAPDRKGLVARTQALDRVLLWGAYGIPQWHINIFRVVYWDKFGRPAINPKYALGFTTWWVDPQKEAALGQRKTN
jgi:microcin C transport system substrate-binding protein